MGKVRAYGWLVLPVRFLLGGLFIFAGCMKLRDVQQFAFAVHAFKLLPEHLEILAAFVVPWIEIIAGAALILGLWVRSAASLLGVMLLAFVGGILSVIARPELGAVKCSCFGEFEYPCTGPIGWCHIVRNSVLLVFAAIPALLGPGPLAFDRVSTK